MKNPQSLAALLCQLKDNRRKQGRRHSLAEILLTVLLGTMSGYYGYRGLEDFCIRYEKELKKVLGHPKHGIASYSSIRRVLMNQDFNILSQKLDQWVSGKVVIKKGEWLQIDGKGMKGTLSNYEDRQQDFISMVSLFMDRSGITLLTAPMSNKSQSEINVVRELIGRLELKGMVISMDALHCQKKRLPVSKPR